MLPSGFLQGGPTCLLWGKGLASSPCGAPKVSPWSSSQMS